jgi:cell division transport system permease protein
MRSFLFLLREFLVSLSQNRFLHFTYGAQVTISLLVLGMFFILITGAVVAWNRLGTNLKINVYLQDDLSETEISNLEATLAELPHVANVEYRSKRDAFEYMRRNYPDLDISGLGDNFLPASFVVSASQPRYIEQIVGAINSLTGIEQVDYGSDFVRNFVRVAMILVVICIVTIFLLIVFTSSSISNIIGLSIYARRTEIRIMQLVGATWWFIRWPFSFEGVFFGIIGALVASLVLTALMAMLNEALRLSELMVMLPFIDLNANTVFAALLVLLLGLGAAVGFYGSLRTVNAFLAREYEIQLDAARVRRLIR